MTMPADETPPPATPAAGPAAVVRPGRPWLGPAIASGVVLLVILVLLIPGLLLFPRPVQAAAMDAEAIDEANKALQQRVDKLRALVDAGVCSANGTLRLKNEAPGGPTQADLNEAIPPELSRRQGSPALGDAAAPEAPGAPAPGQSAFLDAVDKGVSLIVADKGSGTGFFIAPDLVVTNAHVAEGPVGTRVLVFNKGIGKPVEAVVEATSGHGQMGGRDFALLRLQGGVTAPAVLPLAATPPRTQTVIAAGYPGLILKSDPNFQALFKGDVSHLPDASTWTGVVAHVQRPAGQEVIVHSAELSPGNSGGPLLDRCGRVAGVNTYITFEQSSGRGLNYSLSSGALAEWLQASGQAIQLDSSPCRPSSGAPEVQQ